jgi:hypothetical protein
MRIVDFLLRYQTGARSRRLCQAGVGRVRRGVVGLCSLQVALSAHNLLLCSSSRRISSGKLRREFRHFQDGQSLPFLNVIPHIDVYLADVARDFGVHVDVLKSFEFASERQRSGQAVAFYFRDTRNRVRGIGGVRGINSSSSGLRAIASEPQPGYGGHGDKNDNDHNFAIHPMFLGAVWASDVSHRQRHPQNVRRARQLKTIRFFADSSRQLSVELITRRKEPREAGGTTDSRDSAVVPSQ